MDRKILLVMVILAAVVSGCTMRRAIIKTDTVMTSTPEVQAVSKADYDIHLKPLTNGRDAYVAFELTLQNRSPQSIFVDWNTTRYLYQGRSVGRVVWRGIDRKAFMRERVALEEVAPGQTFSKEIVPQQVVAWVPHRSRQSGSAESSLTSDNLPTGENGLRFFVRHNGHLLRETLIVFLAKKEVR